MALALSAAACSFDYAPATTAERLSEIPDSILEDFSQTVVRGGRMVLALEAAEARIYRAGERAVLTNARFREYDAQGGVVVEGRAGSGIFHTDTENAEFSGGVVVHSLRDRATIATEAVEWDRQKRLLRTPPEGVVTVEREDGSRLSGAGFEADFRTRTIRFTRGASGTVVHRPGTTYGP